MKLISLNTWGGRIFEPLMAFLAQQAEDTDIFCFQEIYDTPSDQTHTRTARANIYAEIKKQLPDFTGYFAPAVDNYDEVGKTDFPCSFGLATFIRSTLPVNTTGDIFVYRDRFMPHEVIDGSTQARNLQFTEVVQGDKRLTICNFHGLWYYSSKGDNEHRLLQSQKIQNFLDSIEGPIVLTGDFNLLPDTQSIAIIEKSLRNLIKEYHITSTRSSLYSKPLRYADYLFVNKDVQVLDFDVPHVAISDHLPLVLTFNL